MDIRSRQVDALILKTRDYREQDKLLFIASAERGTETVIARGARKANGSLRSLAQPFCQAELLLSPAKNGLSFVQEGLPKQSFVALADGNLSRFAYAAYIAELALAAWPEHKPWPQFFGLLLAAFSLLKLDEQHSRTARLFELRLLQLQGSISQIERCGSCGAPAMNRRFCLSPQHGELLCEACCGITGAPLVSAGAARTMHMLLTAPLSRLLELRISRAITAEMELAVPHYLNYQLDYAAKAQKVLQQLLQD